MTGRKGLAAALAAGLLAVAALAAWAMPRAAGQPSELGLFTTLPIYWAESGSIEETLSAAAPPHWARGQLERDHRLVPLDTLDAPQIARLKRLLVAQPRALTPQENVALDSWVRRGGRVLLFADPMLTGHSRFAIGDRRRPQDVVLLSPLLRRWGLELTFDEDQATDVHTVAIGAAAVPVQLAGALRPVPPGSPARCTLIAAGVAADCAIGRGRALIVADAALLDSEAPEGAAAALEALQTRIF